MAFGLTSTSTLSDYKSLNKRRKIFLQFPTGAAPLMALLSMLDSEETDKVEFGWFERRYPLQYTQTTPTGTAPFLNEDGSALADLSPLTANVEYRLVVVSTAEIKPTHVIEIRGVTKNNVTTTTFNVRGVVTRIISSTVLVFRPLSTLGTAGAGVDNGTADNFGLNVMNIGTANRENSRSGSGIISFPISPTNYTQIFRTSFNISRTAMKQGLTYDSSGPYKNLAWDNGQRHMCEMERAFFFGERHTTNVADPETGDVTAETTTGGVRWFLEQWEAADSIYRGGTGVATAVTSNTDDNKRIIQLGGTLSKAQYNTYIDRAFQKTGDKAYEKICFCGGKFLATVNALFERDIVRNTAFKESETTAEFMVHSHTTLRGTVHYKVHPLLDMDPIWSDSAFILDMGYLHFRPLTDSDTTFVKNLQEKDRDGRKDGWITEAGLELHFPEAHMVLQGATAAA